MLLLSQSKFFNPTSPGIIPPHLFGEGVPDLEDLFGSLDLCQCEHCASVYSPAAYLVDILHFLMNRPANTPGRTALDVLFGNPEDETRRRWDIGEIELTCHNTNTALPHIDLVNEILEQAVAPNGGFHFKPRATPMRSAPTLSTSTSRHTPFWQTRSTPGACLSISSAAEARRYLAQLGVRRDVLMEHFRREGAAPLPIDVSRRISGPDAARTRHHQRQRYETTRQMWGMGTAEFNQLLAEAARHSRAGSLGPFVRGAGRILDVGLVNPGGAMRIQFAGADCNLATATITGLTSASLGSHASLRPPSAQAGLADL